MRTISNRSLAYVFVTTFAIVFTLASGYLSVAKADAYVSLHGGANWSDTVSAPGVEDETGFAIGAAVGMPVKSVPGLRLEGEVSYRNNEVDVFKFITADHESFTIMGNVVYDLPVHLGPVQPYVLGGVGYGQSTATFENVALLKLESSGLAYQLGAGAEVDIADGIRAGIGYRYVVTPEIEVLGLELSDGSNHEVLATIRFGL